MGNGSLCINIGGLVLALVVAMVAPLSQLEQPEECRLYKVTSDHPSPTLEVPGKNSDTYISLDLLFENATASVNISNGESSSCEITVDRTNGTMQGDCFGPKEVPLKCSQVGGLNTIVLRRNGGLLVVFKQGDSSDSKVLSISAPNINKGVQIQVNSDSIVNTAFNCPDHCFQFNNAILHSKDNLTLSAKQTSGGNAKGVIKVLHSDAQGQVLNEEKEFNFTYPQNDAKVNDADGWRMFYVASNYTNVTDSITFLSVSGSLTGSDISDVGSVPSLNTYIQFEDMDNILWKVCEKSQSSDSNLDTRIVNNDQNPAKGIYTNGSETGVTRAVDYEDLTTLDGETETDNTIETNTGDTTINTEEATTIKREREELSCKDTWEPICILRNDEGGACNCAEAKQKGLCDKLDSHLYVKDNCNKTCGLCPDQVSDLPVTADISGGGINNTGESAGVSEGTPILGGDKPAGGNTGYIILGIVAAVLLCLLIWILVKKKRTSRTMDLEGQTIAVKESTETPEVNIIDTDETKKQDQDANNKGAENVAFQEQEDVKKDTEIIDEKDNKDDINKTIKDSSPVSNENDTTKDDSNNKAVPLTKEKVNEPADQKTTGDGIDDGLVMERDDDKSTQEEKEQDSKIEKEDELESKNENNSKDVDDNLESKKV